MLTIIRVWTKILTSARLLLCSKRSFMLGALSILDYARILMWMIKVYIVYLWYMLLDAIGMASAFQALLGLTLRSTNQTLLQWSVIHAIIIMNQILGDSNVLSSMKLSDEWSHKVAASAWNKKFHSNNVLIYK